MRRLFALCLLLAACATRDLPVVQACQAQANEDPEVRRLLAASAGSEVFLKLHHYELQDARRQAELRCLRARGVVAPGGVEQPKRDPSLFNGLF